jgi:hypothetical protein
MMQDAAGVFSANCHEGRATLLKMKACVVTFTLTAMRARATTLKMKVVAVTFTLTLPYRLRLIRGRSRGLVHCHR